MLPDRSERQQLGATPVDGGTRFEVWAPFAESVSVVVEPRNGSERTVALDPPPDDETPTSAQSTWTAVVDGVAAGDRYRFRLDDAAPLPDPASRLQPDGVHGPSQVVDLDAFLWTDSDWAGVELRDTILYELHVGTFTRAGTFDAAADELERLADLGVTTIELMPVAAFPGRRNWGYDGVFPFATQASYGGPSGLARFVDAAHAYGLGVVLDVVYNHLGPEGNVLPSFGPYLTDSYATPWGGALNASERFSDAVRRYAIENAVSWIRDFHLDGLRLDAVHAIVDPTARPFVAELTDAVHAVGDRQGRTVLVTVESSANDPTIVRPDTDHGWGCDAVWNDDVHHALRVALTGERHEYYAGYGGAVDVARALERRWVYDGQHSVVAGRRHGAPADDLDHRSFIVFAQNHDHVGNTPRGHRLLHEAGPGDPRLRLAAAATLLSPFTPLLFMGEEYAERAPFPYFVDHGDPGLVEAVREGRRREFAGADWSGEVADPASPETYSSAVLDPGLAEGGPHRAMLDLYRQLIDARRRFDVLTDPTAVHSVTYEDGLVVVRRSLGSVESLLALNFSDEERVVPHAVGHRIVVDTGPNTTDDSRSVAAWSARLTVSA